MDLSLKISLLTLLIWLLSPSVPLRADNDSMSVREDSLRLRATLSESSPERILQMADSAKECGDNPLALSLYMLLSSSPDTDCSDHSLRIKGYMGAGDMFTCSPDCCAPCRTITVPGANIAKPGFTARAIST